MKKLLIMLASAGLVSTSVFGADTDNTVNIHLTSVVTSLTSTAQLEIDANKLADARDNVPFNEVVATGCAWTNQTAGDMDQTLSVPSTNYEDNGSLALYGIASTNSGDKIKVKLYVSSTNASTQVEMPLNSATQLADHADPNANAAATCANLNSYHLEIAPSDLVNAKSGLYEVQFSIAGSNYTG